MLKKTPTKRSKKTPNNPPSASLDQDAQEDHVLFKGVFSLMLYPMTIVKQFDFMGFHVTTCKKRSIPFPMATFSVQSATAILCVPARLKDIPEDYFNRLIQVLWLDAGSPVPRGDHNEPYQTFRLFGTHYPIVLHEHAGCAYCEIANEALHVYTHRTYQGPKELLKVVYPWAYDTLMTQLRTLLDHWQPHIGQAPKSISIYLTKGRAWGKCTNDKKLLFNIALVHQSIDKISTTVLHELCHLIHFDHSPHFWAQINQIMPDYVIKSDPTSLKDDGDWFRRFD